MLICVGQISKPHGVLGQVKIRTYTSSVEVFLNFKKFYRKNCSVIEFLKIQKLSDNIVIGSIVGVNSRTAAEKLRFTDVYVDRNDLPELKQNEYYYEYLIGMEVYGNYGKFFGIVTGIHNYGAGTFLELPKFTIPFNSDSIIDINITNKTIVVDDKWVV